MKMGVHILLRILLMLIVTAASLFLVHLFVSQAFVPVPQKSDVFFISNTRTCSHWSTDAQRSFSPSGLMSSDAEALYDLSLKLALDDSSSTNSLMAYDCLEKSARLGCGRAQFVLATLWDFDTSAFRLGCVDPEVDPRLSQPRFESINFCSDHNGIHARDIKVVSRDRKINSTLVNGDAARMALFWYRAAVESGINAAMPPMLDLRRKLDQERDRYLGKMKADTAIYSACWLLNRDPLHKDCRCRCPTVRKFPKKFRAKVPCQCPRYNDASLAMEILERAAKEGSGSARLALAIAEEILIDPLFSFRDAEFKDVVAKFYGDARTLYRFAYPKGSITNSQVVAYVTSLYRKAIEAGDPNAPEQLTRFRKRVAAAMPVRVEQERKTTQKERLPSLKEARTPLTYEVPAGSKFELFGYVMGQTYQPAASGQKVIYGDRINRYIPSYPLPEKFHGMRYISCELTPISKRLYSMSLNRSDFAGRKELMDEGNAVLGNLGKLLGYKLSPFRYEVPDGPYWPCDVWSGPLPELIVADENQWATSKNVFAVSNTKIGSVSIKVKLDVVSSNRFNLSVKANDETVASEGTREFEEDFKKHHEGITFNDWGRDVAFRRSSIYLKNKTRQPLPDNFNVAGHSLGERMDPASFAKRFNIAASYRREITVRLPEYFMGVFSHIGIATNSTGCVNSINLMSDLMTSAEQAFAKYEKAREYLRSHGMDDYYEENTGATQEIQDFYEPNVKSWTNRDFCCLKWVDKSRSVEIELGLNVDKKYGMAIFLVVRQATQDSATNDQWRRGLDQIRNGKPLTGQAPL